MKQNRIVFLALLCCLLALAACGKSAATAPAGSEESEASGPVKIETPLDDLQFPGTFSEQLKTEVEESGDRAVVHFRADLADRQFDLFNVTIAPEEGDSVGTIKDAEGTVRNVFVEIFDLDADGLSADDQNTLFAMQEGVNDVISALNH